MKAIAALAAGVLLSFMTFVAGVLGTAVYLSETPAPKAQRSSDVSDLWTSEPVAVATQGQRLERVAARSIQQEDRSEETYPIEGGEAAYIDRVETGSTPGIEQALFTETEPANPNHVEWCASRYNSYRAEDDTYQPYRGKRRRCNSPYQDVANNVSDFVTVAQANAVRSRTLGDDAADTFTIRSAYVVDREHAKRCNTRYRSYRMDDNTYQPLSGGPRRQCR
jgi:hypothetical protein